MSVCELKYEKLEENVLHLEDTYHASKHTHWLIHVLNACSGNETSLVSNYP